MPKWGDVLDLRTRLVSSGYPTGWTTARGSLPGRLTSATRHVFPQFSTHIVTYERGQVHNVGSITVIRGLYICCHLLVIYSPNLNIPNAIRFRTARKLDRQVASISSSEKNSLLTIQLEASSENYKRSQLLTVECDLNRPWLFWNSRNCCSLSRT